VILESIIKVATMKEVVLFQILILCVCQISPGSTQIW
jgi:hypothetical protein